MGDATIVEPVPSGGDGGESAYNPLCGVPSDGCLPDDSESCPDGLAGAPNESSGATGGTGGSATAGTAGSSGGKAGAGGPTGVSGGGIGGTPSASAGGSGEGGDGGTFPGGNGGEAGVIAGEGGANPTQPANPGGEGGNGGEAGAAAGGSSIGTAGAGAGGDGGQSGGGTGSVGGSVPWPYSCQVRVTSNRVASVCKPAGSGKAGDGCFSGADCAAGLGCVGEQSPGQCRPYCCEGSDSCVERGTHCAEQRLVGESARPRVPVCMPATGCDLADCTGGATCTCPEGDACVIVTGDGTTSCVPTSSLPSGDQGQAGAECPCAFGHFCSEATNRCVKLCQTSAANGGQGGSGGSGSSTSCGRGRCQASPGLPMGWGVCIGSE
jgi:hypothetical protein